MEAAKAALANPSYVEEAVVLSPRLLAPLVLADAERSSMVGPDGVVGWREGVACAWQPEIACVLGRGGRNVTQADAREMIFGYLLAATWTAPSGEASLARSALGPCLVTTDEFDPSEITLTARVNRGVWQRERIGDATSRFARTIVRASKEREVLPGEVFSSPPFDSSVARAGSRRLTKDGVVEIEAGPLGVLRNRVRFRRSTRPAGAVRRSRSAN
jgi:2-keto-4-pentenoate hydratase/2-oxohepta-3-ene-1,7-dioic acid hydratase in catechol pathway